MSMMGTPILTLWSGNIASLGQKHKNLLGASNVQPGNWKAYSQSSDSDHRHSPQMTLFRLRIIALTCLPLTSLGTPRPGPPPDKDIVTLPWPFTSCQAAFRVYSSSLSFGVAQDPDRNTKTEATSSISPSGPHVHIRASGRKRKAGLTPISLTLGLELMTSFILWLPTGCPLHFLRRVET